MPRQARVAYLTAGDVAALLTNRGGRRRASAEKLGREYFFRFSRRVSPIVARDSGGIRYLLYTSDLWIGGVTYVKGDFEIGKLLTADRLLTEQLGRGVEGMEFLDIGANVGTTTLPAIKRCGAGHVWAFEPAPSNLKLLRCNLVLNDLTDQVDVLPIALSNESGTLDLELSGLDGGDHRIVVSHDDGAYHEKGRPTVPVPVARLDDVIEERSIDLDRVGLAWIDVQGHEGHLLEGASALLRSAVPVVTEYWPYGLRRGQCLDLFHKLVEENFRTVVNLGEPGHPRYPAQDIVSLESRYREPGSQTDLLLLH